MGSLGGFFCTLTSLPFRLTFVSVFVCNFAGLEDLVQECLMSLPSVASDLGLT